MNILLPFSEIKKVLKTDATAEEFQQFLSLSGPSVERIHQLSNGEAVFDIEVTANRIDSACIAGIAQEAHAILPRFNKQAELIKNLLSDYSFSMVTFGSEDMLKPSIDSLLCPRFTAVVLDRVLVKDSPEFIQKTLEAAGIRSINNVVDISNYLMLLFGQPVHMFDYNKIKKGVLTVRQSKKGEKIALLDEKTYELTGEDIVIEDGEGRLIDLCGIMGGKLSEVDHSTTRVVLFVQTYDKVRVRRTSMRTGARSAAAAYFEKGLDSERVEPTLVYGIQLLKEYAGASVASRLYDENHHQYTTHTIAVSAGYFSKKMGVAMKQTEAASILESLGFTTRQEKDGLTVGVPFWRQYDVVDADDLFEEVARIYGYHNLDAELPPFAFVTDEIIRKETLLNTILTRIKEYLMDAGFNEVYNYSMLSREEVKRFGLSENSLHIENPISTELVYLRQSLIPSLVKNCALNKQYKKLNLFEAARVYGPHNNKLPQEQLKLSLITTQSFFEAKGIVERIGDIINSTPFLFSKKEPLWRFMQEGHTAEIIGGEQEVIGTIGLLQQDITYELGIGELVFVELDVAALMKNTRSVRPFPLREKEPYVIEDITYKRTAQGQLLPWNRVESGIVEAVPAVKKVKWVGEFDNWATMRLYSHPSAGTVAPDVINYLENILGTMVKRG